MVGIDKIACPELLDAEIDGVVINDVMWYDAEQAIALLGYKTISAVKNVESENKQNLKELCPNLKRNGRPRIYLNGAGIDDIMIRSRNTEALKIHKARKLPSVKIVREEADLLLDIETCLTQFSIAYREQEKVTINRK